MTILAIDPGPAESAFVIWDGKLVSHGKWPNEKLLTACHAERCTAGADVLVIEKVACMGMAVGAEVFETVYWSGRFAEAYLGQSLRRKVDRVPRMAVKMHLCGRATARDPNIRQALIDRFGGPVAIKGPRKARPRKGIPELPAGMLYGVSGDVWAALAVAVTYWDKRGIGDA